MAKFVEEGGHVVVRQEGGLAHAVGFAAFGKIAHQVGDGCLQRAGVRAQPAGAHIVHPGAAALAAARARVQVKLAHQYAARRRLALYAVKVHAFVPDRGRVLGDDDVKKAFHNLEQAGQHLGQREILFDLLLAEGVARFLELFANKGPVPGLGGVQVQVFGGKGAQLGYVAFGVRAGAFGQVAQKANHRFGRISHLGRD